MMSENSKEVTGSHAVQDDPATYCAEKDGLEESMMPMPLPLKSWDYACAIMPSSQEFEMSV